ncbi:MAG: HXXEE domain-containing protein [Acidobacteriota bacterium]
MIRWLFIFPLIAASIHIFEEFAFPGGFRAWYVSYRPQIEKSLTTRRLVTFNLILLVACASFAITGPRHGGTTTWLIAVSIIAWNSVFHLLGAFRTHRYSPGMISAILLYLPLTFGGFYLLLWHSVATLSSFAICFGIGTLYHVIAESDFRFKWAKRGLS